MMHGTYKVKRNKKAFILKMRIVYKLIFFSKLQIPFERY
jgi:hypothetical protein